MSEMKLTYYSELLPVLSDRARLSAISQLGFSNVPLRRHLKDVFGRAYGESGGFLADPTFEAVFGWKGGNRSMRELEGNLLTSDLVKAMDQAGNYRFAKDLYPYTHQLESWEILAQDKPRSLVAASGTGSGKTECFMVPILDRLLRQRQQQQSKLIGVRALFLYPLNALINSQRHRLRAWTEPFGEDVRFCLYNGITPERPDPARLQRQHPSEVGDRQTLRDTPPPILVTNSTMLEYMLVRTVDAPILEQSQGKLEWVVLDEAHTYIGSQAAEIALLLRRVLNAFGVQPKNVRFVATSATIGDPKGAAGQSLKRFLAEVAGVDPENVYLVSGDRQVPGLPDRKEAPELSLGELAAIEPDQDSAPKRYEVLGQHMLARRIRNVFTQQGAGAPVARLSEVCVSLFGKKEHYNREQQQQALQWMDLLSGTRNKLDDGGMGEAFLPLRAHFYHQTLSGIWACADAGCNQKQGTELRDERWPFGRIYLEPRKHCKCGSPVYELINCGECGSVYLLAGVQEGSLLHVQPEHLLDEFELEIETIDEESEIEKDTQEQSKKSQHKVLIVNQQLSTVGRLDIDKGTRKITEPSQHTLSLLAQEDAGEGLKCPSCEAVEGYGKRLFYHARLSAPLMLGGILPTLLEYAPDGDKPEDHPYRGRRLLTFNDSRQGTARMAARLQQDAERNRVRGLVYHLCLQHAHSSSATEADAIKQEILILEQAYSSSPNDALGQLISDKEAKLAQFGTPSPIPFEKLAQDLSRQGRDFKYMFRHYRHFAPDVFTQVTGELELARMFLVREFGRRPKRANNLESMGLVAIRYPALEHIDRVPDTVVQAAGFDLQNWQDFLKICLDFFVRGGGSLAFPLIWRNWLGVPFPQTWLVPRDQEFVSKFQRRWPRAKRSGLQSTLVRLLAYVLDLDLKTAIGVDRVDTVLQAAWEALCNRGLLKQEGDGRILSLDQLAFVPMDQAWICPVTRRFLDTTLKTVTPYLPKKAIEATAACQLQQIPLYDAPFGDVTDGQERIKLGRQWLSRQVVIEELRDQGLWSNLNDRVIELVPYFKTAEHSAQQDSKILQGFEKAFQEGDINLLSCSTTMEMGIDIGGISLVAMNNVPPHPSNYLQRAGRAGRRQEARSLAMTLCKSNPHDQAVFNNTRWAFDTQLPAPKVSLDSQVIVQRHIHSYLLSRFLSEALKGSGQEQVKLTCGLFFKDQDALSEQFTVWCRGHATHKPGKIAEGLTQIIRHTVLEPQSLARIMEEAAEIMSELADAWQVEWKNLDAEILQIKKESGEKSPAFRAVSFHMRRLEEEYLLRELATRGFLPAYGFPTNIAPFDNYTVEQFKREKKEQNGREDNRYRRREMASRDLASALREYAPGSEIVMNGLVYRSAGVTLNWHIPANQEGIREVQNIRHAWRCSQCGASGSTHSLKEASQCQICEATVKGSNKWEFLEPAGFAVDFYKDPTNDITSQQFVPVEQPWIDVEDDWYPLSNPDLGRIRTTSRGHVFHHSRGIHGTGYALCLECGRAEPMASNRTLPKVFEEPHRKLRRSKEDAPYCPGSTDEWKIKRGIVLGHEAWTDVCELQLKTENGIWLNDPVAALTLAVALRDALAGLIGVQSNELGCDIKPAKTQEGTRCQSILLFDRYSAGYASNAERYLDQLFKQARVHLLCPVNCDSVCPHCVLDFDQRFAAENMDRHQALAVLSENWLNQFKLPQEYAFFGSDSYAEYKSLTESIWQVISRKSVSEIRLYAGGVAEQWDVAPSSLRKLAYQIGSHNIDVSLMLPDLGLDNLEEADLYLLASMAETPHINIYVIKSVPRCGEGWLIAETLGGEQVSWATATDHALVFSQDWGAIDGPLVKGEQNKSGSIAKALVSADRLRPKIVDKGDLELEIHHELDGSLNGFGKRFWGYLSGQHAASMGLLSDSKDRIISISYRDRYLFNPISVVLLGEIVRGLKAFLGQERWVCYQLDVFTLARRPNDGRGVGGKLWSDWSKTELRDQVLVSMFDLLGIQAIVNRGDARNTGHGRLLEIAFESGSVLTVRLDQGVSYWRVAQSAPYLKKQFDLLGEGPEVQAKRLIMLDTPLVAGDLSTQLFLKVR